MNTGRDDLEGLAASVTDELKIDWLAERAARPDVARVLEELETLERLARFQRASRDGREPARPLFSWGVLRVTAKLGEGGSAEVWRAWDPALQREVALKLRRAGDEVAGARRWLDEARRLARVRHPHVLAVYGADVHDGRAGLWCERIDGETLDAMLAERGALGAGEAALIGLDLCRALAAIHAAGLIHGDVKASNVMREAGGRIVLMDLGAGSEVLPGDAGAAVEFATPQAAAPEVLRGEGASVRSDLWSLGALLYRLVTARHVVAGESFSEIHAGHERGERVPLRDLRPDLPAAFVAAIERALAANPDDRFASAGAMEQALAATVAPGTPAAAIATAPAAPATGATGAGSRRALWLGALAVVVTIAAVAIGMWAMRRPAADSGVVPPVESRATASPGADPGAAASGETPAVPAAPIPLEPDVALFVARDGASSRMPSSGEVRPGDQLYLEVQHPTTLHVYVLDEDEAGNVHVLFPMAGFDLANPLAGGLRHRLPGRQGGTLQDWKVTTSGGRDHVLVVAVDGPHAALDQAVARLAAGERLAAPSGEAPAATPRRGIGGHGVTAAPDTEPENLRAIERLLAADQRAGRAWLRSWTLDNP